MWYSAIGERRREQQYLAYAESEDGVTWRDGLYIGLLQIRTAAGCGAIPGRTSCR